MTKQRKQKIWDINIKLQQNKIELQSVLNEEENAFDSMPENLQYSIRGQDSEVAIDCLNEAIDGLDDVINNLAGI